jgi:hypothetical protein
MCLFETVNFAWCSVSRKAVERFIVSLLASRSVLLGFWFFVVVGVEVNYTKNATAERSLKGSVQDVIY